MLQNYLKIAFRHLLRHKGYAFINIFGLAVGLACCLLMVLFVLDELSYDRFHEKGDRIYRVVMEVQRGDVVSKSLFVHKGLAPMLQEELPEVEVAVRLGAYKKQFRVGEEMRTVDVLRVEPAALEMFTFPLAVGDARTALADPNNAIISKKVAADLFPGQNPLGKVLEAGVGQDSETYTITGVMQDIPGNTHLPADVLVADRYREQDNTLDWKAYSAAPLYFLASPNTDPGKLEKKINALNQKKPYAGGIILSLQRLTDIHLYSHLDREISVNGDIRYVYIFSAAALLILFIACINFINLATARSLHRAKEVGVRKVIGARRFQLIGQFLGESFLFFALALVLAGLLVEFCLPYFNNLIGKSLAVSSFYRLEAGLLVGGLLVLIGLLAGGYPALYLSAQSPVFALKGMLRTSTLNARMRQGLVVVQFTISLILIVATGVVYYQLHFISSARLGFNKEQVLVVQEWDWGGKQQAFKEEMLRHSGVESASIASWQPGKGFSGQSSVSDPSNQGKFIQFFFIYSDLDFLKTLQIELVRGRDFSRDFGADRAEREESAEDEQREEEGSRPVIINEVAAKRISAEEPAGLEKEELARHFFGGKVIGVMRDFHGLSLHHEIPAIVLNATPDNASGDLFLRVRPNAIPASLAHLEQQWKIFFPERGLEFYFLDDYLQQLYLSEQRLGQLFMIFALFGIGIACLGLFGLASFTAEQRTKEIGIRKVLGASVTNIVQLLSKDFVKLVLVANLLAWPVAWYAMGKWLEDFAYRIDLEWWVFAAAGALALVIALLTVSSQAVKAALMNPVKSLRSE
ncbi:ABC transporter permease [soil metagenome]